MQPAASVIIFTALSGLGFGLMAWLGIGRPDVSGGSAFAHYFVAYALAVGGLLASTLHLGHPERALKAFSQWRSSWLSREGVAAVVTLLVVAPFAIGRIFLGQDFVVLGWIGAALSLVTVFTTSMIYTQLKTVPRWNTWTTPVLFLIYAVFGGALLAGQVMVAGIGLLILTGVQWFAWGQGDGRFQEAGSTIESATGLGRIGKVRQLESPHSGTNYLLTEMVHVVGRKHGAKLRVISALTLGLIPGVMLLALPVGYPVALLAVALHVIGLFTARWLFFAQAEHVVGLYYDKR